MSGLGGIAEPSLLMCYNTLINAPTSVKVSISIVFAFALYYKTRISKVPQLICKQGILKKLLKEHVPATQERFSPSVLLFGSVPQTVAGTLIRPTPKVDWNEVEDIDLADNGQVHLSWLHGAGPVASNKPTVILLPGLTGDSNSNYIRLFARLLEQAGYRVVVFVYRGMGGKELKTAKTYCACYTDDFKHVVEHIKVRYPESSLMAIGTSLGAMILFHYLVRTGKDAGLLAAMVISIPWNPFESSKSLCEPFNKLLYNRHLTNSLISMVEKNSKMFEKMVNLDHVRQSSTIHEFDEAFTAKVFGFESLDHYYTTATAGDKVGKVHIPLLALNAADDPFSPEYCIPVDDIANSDHVALLLTERGGHVGFIDTLLARGTIYMDRVLLQYVNAMFDNQELLASI